MMPPGSRASLADLFFVIGDASWSSFLILFDAGSAQALAGEIDPVRIMDEAIKDRIGVRGLGESSRALKMVLFFATARSYQSVKFLNGFPSSLSAIDCVNDIAIEIKDERRDTG